MIWLRPFLVLALPAIRRRKYIAVWVITRISMHKLFQDFIGRQHFNQMFF
jgi:hypothetical protein